MLDGAELIFAKNPGCSRDASRIICHVKCGLTSLRYLLWHFCQEGLGRIIWMYINYYSSAIFGTILILSILRFRCHFFFKTQIQVPWGFFFSLSNQKNTYENKQHPTHKASVVCDTFHWVSGRNEPGSTLSCQELGTFHFPHYEDVNQMSLRFMKSGKILATSKGSSSGGKLGVFLGCFLIPCNSDHKVIWFLLKWCCWNGEYLQWKSMFSYSSAGFSVCAECSDDCTKGSLNRYLDWPSCHTYMQFWWLIYSTSWHGELFIYWF